MSVAAVVVILLGSGAVGNDGGDESPMQTPDTLWRYGPTGNISVGLSFGWGARRRIPDFSSRAEVFLKPPALPVE